MGRGVLSPVVPATTARGENDEDKGARRPENRR
jgi:hypothetical protein